MKLGIQHWHEEVIFLNFFHKNCFLISNKNSITGLSQTRKNKILLTLASFSSPLGGKTVRKQYVAQVSLASEPISHSVRLKSIIVCTPSPFLMRGREGGGGWTSNQIFKKKGEGVLDRTSTFRGGCWERGRGDFQGGGRNFHTKKQTNLKYLMTKKSL